MGTISFEFRKQPRLTCLPVPTEIVTDPEPKTSSLTSVPSEDETGYKTLTHNCPSPEFPIPPTFHVELLILFRVTLTLQESLPMEISAMIIAQRQTGNS
jgi:hypothetical protein